MKKISQKLNKLIVDLLLFFGYFFVLAIAKVIYGFQQNDFNNKSWSKIKIPNDKKYFTSQY